MASTKLKTFKLLEILYNKTDFYHRLTTSMLLEELDKIGIKCDRRSVYDDIKLFRSLGINVKKDGGYYIERDYKFSLEEIKFLTDVLSFTDFFPAEKAESLKDRLAGELKSAEREIINNQFFLDYTRDRRLKARKQSTDAFKIIRILTVAINTKTCVNIKLLKNNRQQLVSPYSLVFYNMNYYLVACNNHAKKIYHYRIDNISEVSYAEPYFTYIEPGKVSDYKDAVDTTEYMTKTFKMYSSDKECEVKLKFKADIFDYIIKYFPNSNFKPEGKGYFSGTANVNLSDGFYNYILGFGNQIQILEPETVAGELKRRAQEIADMYD